MTTSYGAEKGVYQAHQHHEDVSHKWSHPTSHKRGGFKQMAPRTDKHKPTESIKHGKA